MWNRAVTLAVLAFVSMLPACSLHLLGYVHASAADRAVMTDKQALYLVIPREEAWIDHSTSGSPKRGHAKEASI